MVRAEVLRRGLEEWRSVTTATTTDVLTRMDA
jgi:hypothetical protein